MAEEQGQEGLSEEARAFYRRAMATLADAGVPFLVGAAYAFAHYTGIERHTKDFDLFVRPEDKGRALRALEDAGCRVEGVFWWVGKAYDEGGEDCVDVICNTTNGVARVDDAWFAHAATATVLDTPVRLVPAEELIWSKAFLMERERYDGADVAHLLRARGPDLDWPRLLGRFGPHWRVLLSHLILYGFVYPDERTRIPAGVMRDLLDRLRQEIDGPPPAQRDEVCGGTLLSWRGYLDDLEREGYQDARVAGGYVSQEEVDRWTQTFR